MNSDAGTAICLLAGVLLTAALIYFAGRKE